MYARVTSLVHVGIAAALLAASGCGKSPSGEESAAPAPSSAEQASRNKETSAATPAAITEVARPASLASVKASSDSGTIVGWVAFHGTPPKPRPINFGGEKICADLNQGKTPVNENLVINSNGTVKWALVSIRDKMSGDFVPPKEPVVVDQLGCVFEPHVVALLVGQEIEYRNSDPVSHNIRGTPRRNNAFNTIFASKMTTKAKFETPEVGIPLKCDIHFWMAGFVHVMQNPYYAVTGDDGTFVIPSVPPGEYTLQLWHESLKAPTQKLVVKAGEVSEIPFVLSHE